MQYIIHIVHKFYSQDYVNLYVVDDKIKLSEWRFQVINDIQTIANKLSDLLNTLPLNLVMFHRFLKDLNKPSK